MTNLRDNLMKPEDIHDCFNTQTDVIARLENTNRKLAELNLLSEQKFKRVQKSFVNAASMLQKMQGDLGFIHGAIKKLTHLSSLEKSAVDKTTAIVQSKTGEIDVPVNNNIEAQQPVEIKHEAPVQKVEEQNHENVIEENKAPQEVAEPEAKVEEKAEEVPEPEVKAEEKVEAVVEPEVKAEEKAEEVTEPEAKVEEKPQEVVEPEAKAEEEKTEDFKEPEVKAEEEEKTEDVAPPASTEEENTEAQEEKQEGQQPEKKKKKKKGKH